MFRFAVPLLLVLTASTTVCVRGTEPALTSEQTEQIDSILSEACAASGPGCAIAVSRGEQLLYSRGLGLAQLEYRIPIDQQTIFHVASVSKQFTVFAVALLASDGRVDLDADIRMYLPEVPDLGHVITPRHLIHHTSGLRDQWDLFVLAGGRMDDVISTDDVLQLVSRQRALNFVPGDEHYYCNTGYTLLGEIVKRVSEKSLRDFCDEHIFQPLQMTNSHFHDDHRILVPSRAYSYNRASKDEYRRAVLSYATVGATSLLTTAEDLLKWQQNFTHRRVGNDAVFDVMLQRGQLNDGTTIAYAGGVGYGDHSGMEYISHGGADAGFRSYLCGFPQQQLAVAVVANFGSATPRRLALQMADVVLDIDDGTDAQTTEAQQEESDESEVADQPPLTDEERAVCGSYYNPADKAIHVVKATEEGLSIKTGYRKSVKLNRAGPLHFKAQKNTATLSLKFYPQMESTYGRATITRNGGSPQKLEQVDARPEESDLLAVVPGRYYSSELEAFYSIVVQDNRLVLQRRRHPDVRLRERFRDAVSGGRSMLRFTRDDDQAVDGFLLTTGRVRNLQFRRLRDELGQL